MGFIPVNLNDAKESKPVANGRYDLVITAVEETKTKEKGLPQLRCSIGFETQPDAPNLTHFIGIPTANDEPDKAKFKLLLLKRFCVMFKVPFDERGFDTDALIGARAHAEVTLSEPDDAGNIYNRLVVPRIAGEDSPTGQRSAPKPPKS